MGTHASAAPQVEYLSDIVLGISTYTLDYTKILGIDTTSYPLWPKVIPGAPLRIKGKEYAKGIGAPYGEIRVVLDGEYEAFEAEVGVQPGTPGVAVFQVIVDGKPVYNSGEMTEADDPRVVEVPLAGAQEMRLVAPSTAQANWADARLVRSPSVPAAEPVDMAPFARVVTWNPARMDGVRVNRLTEFPAEDVYLETDVAWGRDGAYTVPIAANGEECIGLQWLERRRLRELGLEFDPGTRPSPEGVRVEGWMLRDPLVLDGHSEWQGKWTPIQGHIEADGDRWAFHFRSSDNREVSEGTLKVRWVFPGGRTPIRIRRFTALTTSRWDTVELQLQAEGAAAHGTAGIDVYNGEILEPAGPLRCTWSTAKPLRLRLRATRPRPWGFDRTVLRFRLPTGSFGVAVDDVLLSRRRSGGGHACGVIAANDCVYVADTGLFVTRLPANTTLAAYKDSIRGRETILQQVHRMPDQTFARAIEALYVPVQDRSPTLLSLPADNRKVIVERSGEVGFGPLYLDFVQQRSTHRIRPQLGSGEQHSLPDSGAGEHPGYERKLENGWMPMPRITVREGGLVYHQVAFVLPGGPPNPPELGGASADGRPLCVVEYRIENPGAAPVPAALKLAFVADAQKGEAATVRALAGRVVVSQGEGLLAAVEVQDAAGLQLEAKEDVLTLSGTLAAGATARLTAVVPLEWGLKASQQAGVPAGAGLRARAEDYWRRAIAPSMQIEVPDALLKDLILASQVHCMMAARGEDEGKYIDPWISSTYYASLDTESHAILRGMDLMGQHELARRGYEFFVKRQNPAGYLAHGYTLMGTGQHLWFLSDHYRLTGDKAWWSALAPKMATMCEWTARQTEKTKRRGPDGEKLAPYGLMPAGTVADWQDWGYTFSLNGYYYAGLAQAARSLAETGHPQARRFARQAAEFRKEILRAYHWTQARMPVVPRGDGTWVPGYPFQLLKPGPCEQFFPNYGGAWLYDVELGAHHLVDEGILEPHSKDVDWMVDHMEGTQFMRDGLTAGNLPAEETRKDWFNRGGFPRAQPYYGRYGEVCAHRDDVKAFIRHYFNALAPMFNREDLSIYENPWASVWNKTHETGHFLQLTRLMFAMERGRELWLAPFVPSHWLADGQVVAIANAPTFFGPTSYRIESHVNEGHIDAAVEPPARSAPGRIVLRLRHPDGKRLRRVTVNGRPHRALDAGREIVRLRPTGGPIRVRAEY